EIFGFELDTLDEKTLALRSYPKVLADFPFLAVLQDLINTFPKAKSAQDIINLCMNEKSNLQNEVSAHTFNTTEILENWHLLLESKILKEISPKNFEKFYEE